ncbi:cell wall / vacuolar inhibitor of fructosidase 1 [Ricinus communis]|uniref:Pectinesterase inhibitor, putative n=1 Tax=Ricinus communis TaxID=3988 RepID=B9RZT9_RICCO|nr:cell wall / vacuolar inhibitor of fructosidase 1 [Ricinus communis]EEF43122.1 Pectinesterase inhibitor, putative [Ricinus communis]|eukprot:XP_002519258.1 cell wall / vacuolar inhibitor of fructosidase 1 [Ricinus communis]
MHNTVMSKTSIFLAHAPIFIIFLLLTQSSFVQSDASLISNICKQTPNYNLCVTSLNSDPRSAKADTTGLALIMVDIIKARATASLNFIRHQYHKSPRLKKQLTSCAHGYDAILTLDIPEAYEALQKGVPKFAQDAANDAAVEANSCEGGFHGNSPMKKLNVLVHDTSAVASAVIRLLL